MWLRSFCPKSLKNGNLCNTNVFADLPRKRSDRLKNRYYEVDFEKTQKTNSHHYYGNVDDGRLVNFAPIAVFTTFILTASIGKRLERIDKAYTVCLMYKI